MVQSSIEKWFVTDGLSGHTDPGFMEMDALIDSIVDCSCTRMNKAIDKI